MPKAKIPRKYSHILDELINSEYTRTKNKSEALYLLRTTRPTNSKFHDLLGVIPTAPNTFHIYRKQKAKKSDSTAKHTTWIW